MKKAIFEPPKGGQEIKDLSTELLKVMDYMFLSVVKLELDTGKAWLLHSAGRQEKTAYEFDWESFVRFHLALVEPEEEEKLAALLDRKQLMYMWGTSQSYHRLEVSCRGENEREGLEIIICFEAIGKAPVVYVMTRHNKDDRLLRRIIDLYVYGKCDCFIYLDAAQNSYTMFSGKQNTPMPAVSGDYNQEVLRFAVEYVVPEDREMVLREMALPHVMQKLDAHDVHSFTCGFWEKGVGYTRKQFEYRYYNRAKKTMIMTRTDITEVYEEQQRHSQVLQEALRLAHTDPLTQLLNYQGIREAVSGSLLHFGNMAAILFIDLDDFKDVNDSFGHAAGDKALQQVARVIKSSIRANDHAARIGGDEFVVYLNDIPNEECAVMCAERICNKLVASEFAFGDKHLSCSIGVAISPNDGIEYTELVKIADKRVYQAKARGKNQVAK